MENESDHIKEIGWMSIEQRRNVYNKIMMILFMAFATDASDTVAAASRPIKSQWNEYIYIYAVSRRVSLSCDDDDDDAKPLFVHLHASIAIERAIHIRLMEHAMHRSGSSTQNTKR